MARQTTVKAMLCDVAILLSLLLSLRTRTLVSGKELRVGRSLYREIYVFGQTPRLSEDSMSDRIGRNA